MTQPRPWPRRLTAKAVDKGSIRARYHVCLACGVAIDLHDLAETVRHKDPAHWRVVR